MTASVSGLVACPAAGAVGFGSGRTVMGWVLLVDFAGAGAHGAGDAWGVVDVGVEVDVAVVAERAGVDRLGRVVGVWVVAAGLESPGGADGRGFGGRDGVADGLLSGAQGLTLLSPQSRFDQPLPVHVADCPRDVVEDDVGVEDPGEDRAADFDLERVHVLGALTAGGGSLDLLEDAEGDQRLFPAVG